MALPTMANGAFGKVYKRVYNGQLSAVKKVPQYFLPQMELVRECEIYNLTHHPNVVKLLGPPWLASDGRWCFPLEFITGENLEKAMFSPSSQIQLSRNVRVTIINGMCDGLRHMHRRNICHQDLKPDNIMVEYGTYRAVIIDMGLAKFSFNGLSCGAEGGNWVYAAPEIQWGGIRTTSSDVWAMGKIIAELLVKPRRRLSPSELSVIQNYLQGNPYSDPLYKMLHGSYWARVTMAEIIGQIVIAGELWRRQWLPGHCF